MLPASVIESDIPLGRNAGAFEIMILFIRLLLVKLEPTEESSFGKSGWRK